ncbi:MULTISPECIES: YbdK family carboxylate-amine ligase [unclassified Serratia (in: enterobacteria)]|uniref:YbdK family carboxylate-amine ligase n=1 Tax=unclassified Serratia (in: enterobacteria) TaxID=2647522 RepID=UPI002ECFD549|nr:YbdK family carboxylate-amine ligase [Serratia sp. C2(2)]MEE4445763.1 YbdK family carboxylate-amine ligase [Serratia sp. C2(1)]
MLDIPFKFSPTHSIGVELELQLIDLDSNDLSDKGMEIISKCNDERHVKKEITLSTIEINSSIHETPFTLYEELNGIARKLSDAAACKNCGICGGGRHFSNNWKNQIVTPTERYQEVHQHLGFLAKLSCVFGQHIHIGVKTGDDAIYLCHALIPYLPHFIALSASSPYYQSEDTFFASSRFSALNSFHTFGYIEHGIATWADFTEYVEQSVQLGVIQCLKDIYWEIRPKPEFGTIEIRVCDTPLTLFHAAMLSGYAQLLVKYLLNEREPLAEIYDSVRHTNTFHAQRYGFDADYIDMRNAAKISLKTHMQQTLSKLKNQADPNETKVLRYLEGYIKQGINDAEQLRRMVQAGMSESSIIRTMMNLLVPAEHISYRGSHSLQEAHL